LLLRSKTHISVNARKIVISAQLIGAEPAGGGDLFKDAFERCGRPGCERLSRRDNAWIGEMHVSCGDHEQMPGLAKAGLPR
jgi:hypothetical protein